MTGPEHYREAERLALAARGCVNGVPINHGDGSPVLINEAPELASLAQVHATLALAAATALVTTIPDGVNLNDDPDWCAWLEVASVETS